MTIMLMVVGPMILMTVTVPSITPTSTPIIFQVPYPSMSRSIMPSATTVATITGHRGRLLVAVATGEGMPSGYSPDQAGDVGMIRCWLRRR